MPDPFKPSAALLCKLGSIAIHADEARSALWVVRGRTGHFPTRRDAVAYLERRTDD